MSLRAIVLPVKLFNRFPVEHVINATCAGVINDQLEFLIFNK